VEVVLLEMHRANFSRAIGITRSVVVRCCTLRDGLHLATQLGLKASNGLKIEIKLHAEVVVELVNSNSSDYKTLIDVFV
jgi:hypothetical protein